MSFEPLDNYIQAYRRKLGLSQKELAVLVGFEERSAVAKYEGQLRLPNLDVCLAFEIIFNISILELYAGVALEKREEIAARAAALLESLDDDPKKDQARKIEALSRIARPDEQVIVPLWNGED